MTFPATPLDLRVELNLAGTWTDISQYVNHTDHNAVVINRGRPDGGQTAQPSTATMQWDNRDGRFTVHNPTGPYYGSLNRNTPVRTSVPSAGTYLRFADDNTSMVFPGWGFEDGTVSGWSGTSAVVTNSTAWSQYGTHSLLVTSDGTATTQWLAASPAVVACVPGNTVVASAWVHALNNLASVHVNIDYYTSGSVYISSSSGASAALGTGVTAQYLCSGTAPATAAFARMSVIDSEASATGVAFAVDFAGLTVAVASDIEIQADIQLTNWTASVIASRYTATGNLRSWALWVQGDGTLAFGWSSTGAFAGWHQVVSTSPVPLGRGAVKVTFAVATGTATFYTAPTIAGTWTQLGTAVAFGATALYPAAAPLLIGANADLTAVGTPGIQGQVYAVKVLNGIGGTVVQSPDFTAATAGAPTTTDAQGNIWTVVGTAAFSNRDYRFHGECSALPQTFDPTMQDIWTPVTAAGPLRRLGQANVPVYSALKRAILAQTGTMYPVAYWPCEDMSGSQSIASAVGGPAMSFIGSPGLAGNSSFACSAAIPSMNGASFIGTVPAYVSNGPAVTRFLMSIPSGSGTPAGTVIFREVMTGTIARLELLYGGANVLTLKGYNSIGGTLFTLGPFTYPITGTPVLVSLELTQSGGNINYAVYTWQPGSSSAPGATGTVAGQVGIVQQVQVNPNRGISDGTGIGHIEVQADLAALYTIASPLYAWLGETAGNRFTRLCAENGVAARVYGYPDISVALGAQQPDTLVNLLQQCEDADRGMIYEPRGTMGLGYRTLASMVNQTPLTLDMTQDQIVPPLEPTDDDQYTQNDIVATRVNGSTFRAILADGSPMSIGNPPNGVGDYQFSINVNSLSDSQLASIAGWILRVGTVNETRYPAITVDLASTSAALATLFYPVIDLDVGGFVSVANPPPFLPPGPIKAIVWGSRESIGIKAYVLSWQTQPESPYELQILGGTTPASTDTRADTDGSAVLTAAGAADTRIDVVNLRGLPAWTTSAADFPFDIAIGPERLTVTDIAPTVNQLTGQNATFDGGLGTWVAGLNASVASSAVVHSGSGSLAVTSLAAGTMTAPSCLAANILTQGLGCSQADLLAAAAWVKAATVSRTVNLQIAFYDIAGVLLSTVSGATASDSTTAWTKLTMQAIAPTNTYHCRLIVQVASTGAAGEVHYVDDAYMADWAVVHSLQQSLTVTRSVNGIVKAHSVGENVQLFTPSYLALT